MVRDEGKFGCREASLGRRDYLRSLGAVGASVAGVGTTAAGVGTAATAADARSIAVSAGETRTFQLGSGDTLADTLIDISSGGASYRIVARGNGWTVRNVGVRGSYGAGGQVAPFAVQGSGTIENVYLGDGGSGGATGLFVHPDHTGALTVNGLNVSGWGDNGVYASPPGNGGSHPNPGGGGTVDIANAYGANNGVANFRLGTAGSTCRNCVAVGGDRGFWGYYERTEYAGCSASGAGEQFRAGAEAWPKGRRAVVVLNDCRASGTLNAGPGTVRGDAGSGPATSPPAGVPSSADAAANGG